MLKRLFLDNLSWKILSLAFAASLWLYVSTGTTPTEAPREVPVELKNLPDTLVRTSDVVSMIAIRISGPRELVGGVKNEDLHYEIDLANAQPGPLTTKILPSRIRGLPGELRVTDVSPSQVTIQLEEKVRRQDVPVLIETRGAVAEGYEVVDKVADPRYVTIHGAKPEVVRTRAAPTEVIDLAGVREPIERTVALDLVGRHVEASANQVRARIDVRPKIVKQMFRDVPVRVVGTVFSAKVEPPTLSFTVKGPALTLGALKREDLNVYVDAQGLRPGRHTLQAKIDTPAGSEVVNTELPAVRVILSAAEKAGEKKK